jgi:hypothetical protein
MQHLTEASCYRRREREESERAHQSRTSRARESHLGLATLYRKKLALLDYQAVTLADLPEGPPR